MSNEVTQAEQLAPMPENKMGVMPVNKLLISMSVPMMISMLVQALYNIVDSMFVAQINENAFTALSLAFPAQTLMIAVATGTGVGINALLSKSLGEKDFDRANKTAHNGIFLGFCCFALFAILGIFLSRQFFLWQTDVMEIVNYGTDYLSICCICSFGLFMQVTTEKLLQSTGKTIYSMVTQLIGAVINIILDPILIFGWFGMPELGVAGAAIATVLAQIVASIVAVILNVKKNKEINISLKGFRPSSAIIKKIYAVGLPSIIMASIGSVMTFMINKILIAFTTTATAVFGAYFRLQSFIFMPVFGLNNGMVPIVAYNYGARKKERIIKTIKLSICYAVSLMLIGLAVFWLFPGALLGIFEASPTMLEIGIPALRTISLSFIFAGFSIITLSVCQALGHGFMGLVVSVIRQLVVLVPVAYLLSRTGVLSAIWWAFPIAEVFAVCLSAFFLRQVYRKEIKPLGEVMEAKPEQN